MSIKWNRRLKIEKKGKEKGVTGSSEPKESQYCNFNMKQNRIAWKKWLKDKEEN